MRLSKVVAQAIRKAGKGKDVTTEVGTITEAVLGAVKAYKGSSKGVLKANKDVQVCTVRGTCSASILDDESLLTLIKQRHAAIVTETCNVEADENYSLNAELSRAIATDATLLAATYWLGAETEGSELL